MRLTQNPRSKLASFGLILKLTPATTACTHSKAISCLYISSQHAGRNSSNSDKSFASFAPAFLSFASACLAQAVVSKALVSSMRKYAEARTRGHVLYIYSCHTRAESPGQPSPRISKSLGFGCGVSNGANTKPKAQL